MSDEQKPPPALRLKPRLVPVPPAAAPAGTTPPESPAAILPQTAVPDALPPVAVAPPPLPAAVSGIPKIRFKPRLMAEAGLPSAAPAESSPAAPEAAPANEVAPPPAPSPVAAPPAAPMIQASPPVAPAASATLAESSAEGGGKFKLKPKAPPPPPGLGTSLPPPPPPPIVTDAVPSPSVPPVILPPQSTDEVPKDPPPFPVIAPAKPGRTAPPVPHLSVKAEVPEMRPEQTAADPSAIARKKRAVLVMAGLAAVLVLGGVAFFAYKSFLAPQPPPPPVVKAPAPAPAATKAPVVAAAPPAAQPASPAPATPAAGAPTSLSNTLNTIAHVPAKAIGKAQDAIEARRASGQTRVDPALGGKELADKPAVAPPSGSATPAAKPKTASARTAISKGVSATTELEMASGDASAEFRSFVANAKISGVFQGTPARVMINSRLVRTGETVEANLGIIFEGVDSAKRHLLFKDRSGAVVTHKY